MLLHQRHAVVCDPFSSTSRESSSDSDPTRHARPLPNNKSFEHSTRLNSPVDCTRNRTRRSDLKRYVIRLDAAPLSSVNCRRVHSLRRESFLDALVLEVDLLDVTERVAAAYEALNHFDEHDDVRMK